jgi:hypothetical protein
VTHPTWLRFDKGNMIKIFQMVALFLVPLSPLWLPFFIHHKFGINFDRIFLYLSITFLTLFILTVVIPYHFYGYSEYGDLWACRAFNIENKQELLSKLALSNNWTTNPFVSTFTYLLSWTGVTFYWLTICIIFASFGSVDIKKKYLYTIKIIVIVISCYILSEVDRYQLIDYVMF